MFTDDKQTREGNIRAITDRLEEAFAENEEWLGLIGEAVYQYQKKTVRKMILKDHKRPDGRAITEILSLIHIFRAAREATRETVTTTEDREATRATATITGARGLPGKPR